jgi:hypothetical protein
MENKMSVTELIEAIRNGNYEIRHEENCYCRFNWYIATDDGGHRLDDGCSTDECWIGNILYVNSIEVAQHIHGERLEALVSLVYDNDDFADNADIWEIIEVADRDVYNDLCIGDYGANDEHDRKREESLIEWIKESGYTCYLHYPRNFANEYSYILAEEGSEIGEDWEEVDVEEWAELALRQDDAHTEYFKGFMLAEAQ